MSETSTNAAPLTVALIHGAFADASTARELSVVHVGSSATMLATSSN